MSDLSEQLETLQDTLEELVQLTNEADERQKMFEEEVLEKLSNLSSPGGDFTTYENIP